MLFQYYTKDITQFEFVYEKRGEDALRTIENANKGEISFAHN